MVSCLERDAATAPLQEAYKNYHLVANIHFVGKVLQRVVTGQLQGYLEETGYLDSFQSTFRPGFGTEMTLATLMDDLYQERSRECNTVNSPKYLSNF